jgi:KDO2-lipid IV(A) lauroyltransferase
VEPPELLEEVRKHRAALGTDIVPIDLDTFKLLSAHVRSGGTAVIVSDRDIQGTGYQVELFGRNVCLPQAAIVLALRTGAPVLGAFGYRHGDNRITGRFVPALQFAGATAPMTQPDGSGKRSFKDDLDSGMRALSLMLEREIGRDPGQWVVQQPIFAPGPSSRRTIVSAARWLREMRRALKALARAATRGHAVRSR